MTTNVASSWYGSPELLHLQVRRAEAPDKYTQYGASIDGWSYGALVYELLLGKPLARSD